MQQEQPSVNDPAPTAGVRGFGIPPEVQQQASPPQPVYRPAELRALQAAQQRLDIARANDRSHRHQLAASRLEFDRELRANFQTRLFPEGDLTGSPIRHLQPSSRPDTALPVRKAPSRPIQAGAVPLHPSVEAAITATLKEVDTPAWLVRLVMPLAEQRLKSRLLALARNKAVQRGRARQIHCIRADRVRRDLEVFRVLAWGAYKYLELQGQKGRAKHYTSATYFTVLETLSAITGYGTTACEQAVADLRECGLIATHRAYQDATFRRKPEVEGEPEIEFTMRAITGVWVTVLLKPEREHMRAMVLPSELPEAAPRDLLADRKAGRTAYQFRQEARELKGGESIPSQGGKSKIETILTWALPGSELGKSVKKDSPPFFSDIWNELDEIRQAVAAASAEHPQRRREVVMQAAQVIGKVFKDQNPISIKGYCRMIWRGIQGEMQQRPALQGLLDAIDRTLTFWRESRHDKRPLRAPGAYLRSVLQESGWMEREYLAS